MALHSEQGLRQDRPELAPSLTTAPPQNPEREGPGLEEVQGALETVLGFVEQQDEACLSDEDDAIIILQLLRKVQAHIE